MKFGVLLVVLVAVSASTGPESLGAESLGPESLGPESLGPESLGPESLGPESLGPESLGPESLGPESLGPESLGNVAFEFDPHAHYKFSGVVGERVAANNVGWLIRAPAANPGLLAMFRLRDRLPPPDLVPWAGEFVGKYLISAIQATRMVDDPNLDATLRSVIDELLACQAADGYLGPFRQEDRLLKNWDLWGHYHVMLALLMWHDQTGDAESLTACCKMADLICRIYLDTDRRPRDAGSTEMNLAVIHAMGRLYRATHQDRYLRMMREIEKDWEQEGDYFRTGLAGVEFFRTPKPRWESLHNLQGLVELYLITGDEQYRRAFLNHWQSIRRLDRRNTGGFSSGEKATGTPFEPTAIETCCTIAWMVITVDALRLTGDPAAADELERSTFNGMLGAQHPSGSWWTYNTPMNGRRDASHHSIVFQARTGTPELNCCSVNAPRGLGMLSEWALMRSDEGLIVNYYGPMQARISLSDDRPISVRQTTRYPLEGRVQIKIEPDVASEFTVRVRIPEWSTRTTVQLPGRQESLVPPGKYLAVRRTWKKGDEIQLNFDMSLRHEVGGGEMAGRMSVYRGPLLLAYDLIQNDPSLTEPPVLNPADLANARVSIPAIASGGARIGAYPPWIIVDIPRPATANLRLCDFASAGSRGSRYWSWLPAENLAPPRPLLEYPPDGVAVPAGKMLFTMRRCGQRDISATTHLVISRWPDLRDQVMNVPFGKTSRLVISEGRSEQLAPNVEYQWRLVSENQFGTSDSLPATRRFRIDPNLPAMTDDMLSEFGENEDGLVVQAALETDPTPNYGTLLDGHGWRQVAGSDESPGNSIQLDGIQGMVIYQLRAFPSHDYTISIWFSAARVDGPLGQLFSAWCRGMDDPLRISVEKGQLSARVEAGNAFSTPGVPIKEDQWYHVCVVKSANQLTLYLDGQLAARAQVPTDVYSAARDFALGGNPHYTPGKENLACRVSRLAMYIRAFTDEEVAKHYHVSRH